jgi:predicted  nucleic acid-binding Zn-ribbon protein
MKIAAQISLIVHPQAENIRHQNRQLQSDLARLIVERDDLQHSIIPSITAEYQIKLGALEWRVFQLDCETRAFIRRIEMAQTALNRGEELIYKNIETEIEIEFAAWREQIKQQAREIKSAKERENAPTLSYAESCELQTLYRKLAFSLHPDIVKNPDERSRKLWLQTAEAYKSGDLQTLRTIRLLIGSETETVSADETLSVMETLNNRNAELKQTCEKLLDEITAIKTTAPYILHEILDDETELEKRQNLLREQIETLREKRFQLTKHWAEIMRFAADRENIEIPVEPPDIFADADDWAEIIYDL